MTALNDCGIFNTEFPLNQTIEPSSSVTFFDISVDQIFFPAKAPDKTTQRRQLDELLNGIDETDLVIVTDTIKGIQKAREAEE